MIKIDKLNPFGRMCLSMGMIPSSYAASLTYEEQLIWFCNFLEKEVIPAVNKEGEAIEELQNLYTELKTYVDNYFDNLDIQEEINNKLDDMAESGQLTDIIAQYLGLAGVLAYNTLSDLVSAENIAEGSICLILGKNNYNDNKGAYYKIRTMTSSDVIDGDNIVALDVSDTLIAEKVDNYNPYYEEITYNYSRTNNTNYYTVEIPYKDTNNQEIPFELVEALPDHSPLDNSKNTNFLCNGSLAVSNGETMVDGNVIINGEIVNDNDVSAYCTNEKYMGIKADRTISIYDNDTSASDMVADGVIYGCLIFGKCATNGVIDPAFTFQTIKGPDIFIGQKANKDIIVIACDGRNNHNEGMNYTQMSTILINQGCIDVYALDGGGSTSLTYRSNKLNMNVDDGGTKDRKIAYLFRTPNKNSNTLINKIYNLMGEMKHLLNYQLRPLINNKENKHGYLKMNLAESIHNDPDKPIIPFTVSAPSSDLITYENDVNGGTHFGFASYGIIRYSYKLLLQATGNGNIYFRTMLNNVNNESDQASYAISNGQVFTICNTGIFRVNYNETTDFALAFQANTNNNICNVLNGNITFEFVTLDDEKYYN